MLKGIVLAFVISFSCIGFANAGTTDYVEKGGCNSYWPWSNRMYSMQDDGSLSLKKWSYNGKASVVFIDVWKTPEVGKEFGIRSIPTQIFYNKKGVEIQRHEGFLDEESMKEILDQLISEK